MQQEVRFDELSFWCGGTYGCASAGELLSMVVATSVGLLCFTPHVLRFFLPLIGEPSSLAQEIGVPPNLIRRYLAAWAANTMVAGFWALSIFIDDPRYPLIDSVANLGRASWAVTVIVGLVVGLNFVGHVVSLKLRRWFDTTKKPLVGRSAWDVLVKLGQMAIVLYAILLVLAVLIAAIEMIGVIDLP